MSKQTAIPSTATNLHDKPNILLIMPDQMRGDCLSLDGHPNLMTPNMDTIGYEGVFFTHGYTTCASCIPARRSLMTGQFPANNGVAGYKEGNPIQTPTLPQMLSDAGYYTFLTSRYMHQYPKDEPYGYKQQVIASITNGNDPYSQFLRSIAPESGGVHGHGISHNGWTTRPWQLPDYAHPTSWTVQQARNLLAELSDPAPLFLTTTFHAPHPPFVPPESYLNRYLAMNLGSPSIGAWATPPPNDGIGLPIDAARVQLNGERYKIAAAGYYALINHLDDMLYYLIANFQEYSRKQNRPWIILFTSDHGEMLGDHYYFRKCEPYEGSSHIPFLIWGSEELGFTPHLTIDTPVCLEDIMPTLLELAHIPIPEHVDGKSLVSAMRNEEPISRTWIHGEHSPCYAESQAYHFITDGDWKYIWRPLDGSEQLFPIEKTNIECLDCAHDKQYQLTLKYYRKILIEVLKDRPEGFSDGNQLIPGCKYDAFIPGK